MSFFYSAIKYFSFFLLLFWPMVLFTSVMMFPTSDASNNSSHVLSTMSIVMYPIYICALYWFFDVSVFTITGRTLFISSIVVVFLGMTAFGYTKMIFNVARNINSSGYTITKDEVYINGNLIEGADPNSFQSLTSDLKKDISSFNSPYTKDKNRVYHEGKVIADADPETSKVIEEEYNWWLADKNFIYFQGKKVEGVSSQNYELIDKMFVLTNDKVFFQEKEILSADRSSFKVVRSRITKDANNIFYEEKIILEQADAKAFKMFPEDSALGSFGHDEKNLYDPYQNLVYTEIDYKTLKGFDRGYFTDLNGVYTSVPGTLKKLEGANPEKFNVTGWDEKTGSDANDGTLFFINGEPVK